MDDILSEIAQIREKAMDGKVDMLDPDFITDYENVRPRLQMRIFDTDRNEKRLSGLVNHSFGDYSCAYCILLSKDQDHSMSVMVTPSLLKTWGITKRQLHEDTVIADLNRGPMFVHMGDMMSMMFEGFEPKNYFIEDPALARDLLMDEEPLFVLTNKEKVNGAGLILNPTVQETIADLVGGSYYVLPSSIHEVLIMPDRHDKELVNALSLTEMVRSINESTVAPEDLLSDKVAYFDAESRTLCNAMQYEKEHERPISMPKARSI